MDVVATCKITIYNNHISLYQMKFSLLRNLPVKCTGQFRFPFHLLCGYSFTISFIISNSSALAAKLRYYYHHALGLAT